MPTSLLKPLYIFGIIFLLMRLAYSNFKKTGISDSEVISLAEKENRIIITLDLDFGELYHEKNKSSFGVIVLRLRDQRVEQVNQILKLFFESKQGKKIFLDHSHTLVVLTETTIRIS